MKSNQDSYVYTLTLKEKKTLFLGSSFIVYDSHDRERYSIIASSNSATLFSLPDNKIISKIKDSSSIFSIKKRSYSLYLNNKKIDELEITGYGVLKAREGIMTSYGWKFDIGGIRTVIYNKNKSPILEIVDESNMHTDLFKCSMHYRNQEDELRGMFIMMYLVREYISVKSSDVE